MSAIPALHTPSRRQAASAAKRGSDDPAVDSAARLRALRMLGSAYVLHACDGRIIDYNDAAIAMLGLSRDEMLGLTSLDPRWQAVDSAGRPVAGEDHPPW